MNSRHSFLLTSLCGLLLAAGIASAQGTAAKTDKADPRATIAAKIDGLKTEDVRKTPIDGVYEVTRGADVSYASGDGRYFIVGGDLFDVDADANITENRRRVLRSRLIDTVPESEMLVFSPKDPKYTITVFTDIDCGYCRRMHQQVAEYNRLGISIEYLFYPRGGLASESFDKAVAVWCAPDRRKAMTAAKAGQTLPKGNCTNPVTMDYELGRKVGLDGTPAIYSASGRQIGGYLSPEEMRARLDELAAAPAR